ncbi:nucleoside deaminase [Thiocystis violacea]|uniref:nucleoside deaminase n=1 Tax=Thiocystis violacea TaxID=13725 RepID=UPI001905688B|nr:nucleoside deaminase [Thiocystis violacea]MBK1721061.1 tRNA-specific adenosine deaminase [Thiocystis violacea]
MHRIQIAPPHWLDAFISARETPLASDQARMRLVLDLTREHIRNGSGGPFGAALFDAQSGALIGVGVNLVVASRCSIAHAEMVAIAGAQQRLGAYDLSRVVAGGCVIYSSAEPCAMCLGALPWSGVERLVCAARDEDARAAGFDEGHKPWDWIEGYRRRGIEVTRDVLREDAIALLQAYAAAGGEIYGPADRGGKPG